MELENFFIWDFKINRGLREKFVTTLTVASFFSFMLFLFGPSQLYFTNVFQFPFLFYEIYPYFVAISFSSILLIILLLLPLKFSIYQRVISLLFVLSILSWFQGNILVWDYGIRDGRAIDWSEHFAKGLMESGIWLLFIIIALIKSKFIYKVIQKISIAFILIQLISTVLIAMCVNEYSSIKFYNIDERPRFAFSAKKNVIILVLDSFASDIFQEIINEDSYYKDIFAGFTYFRNALAKFVFSEGSMVTILTGKCYDNSITFENFIKNAYSSSSSIPKVLKENGFQVNLFPYVNRTVYFREDIASNIIKREIPADIDTYAYDIARMYDLTLFRYSPHFIKKYIYNNKSWFLRPLGFKKGDNSAKNLPDNLIFIREMVSRAAIVSNDKNTFVFYHILGMHHPLRLDDKMKLERLPLNRQGAKKQAKGLLKLVKIFLDTIKKMGIYDNSMIFIVGDHGWSWEPCGYIIPPEHPNTRGDKSEYCRSPCFIEKAVPLILVKPFNSKGKMRISNAPVSLSDIPKTIISELGLKLKSNFRGISMFKIKESDFRERIFLDCSARPSSWAEDYFSNMEELVVSGFSWLPESWRTTGRKFNPSRIKKSFVWFKY